MRASTFISTGHPEFDELIPRVGSILERNALDIVIDGQKIRGYRTPDAPSFWIRDTSDMLRAVKYFEKDVQSLIQHFAETQAHNGRIFDYVTTFPEKRPCERENWTKYVRVPVEADVEYRFVKAAYLAWQASGDDAWIVGLMPAMEKALAYILSHPWRWDETLRLVKRAYTIDTWDFAYSAGAHEWLQFQITEDTFWGIMHGDNSGYYEAFTLLSFLHEMFGEAGRASFWRERAQDLKAQMNSVCWNGRFYTHFVRITPGSIPGVHEAEQLSLSNPMDINRGVASHEQAVSIIQEYQKRRTRTSAFAEWFSIDPPFPDGIFGDERLVRGAYVNGGIMPLVGGELARAAFEHGHETYGADILRRYHRLISQTEASYLWYFPDGTPPRKETSTSPEVSPADAWGSSAMLYALVEGLAGIQDRSKVFQKVRLSPRWPAAGVARAEVGVHYRSSGAEFGYAYRMSENRIHMEVRASGSDVRFHVLLPHKAGRVSVVAAGKETPFSLEKIEESSYVDFSARVNGSLEILIRFEPRKEVP
ncbi:MAG: hypothetical protein ACE5LV_04290 [Candidatus Aminicenantales bacterium]